MQALTTPSLEKGYLEMFESLFPTLEQLLQTRIDSAQRKLTVSIAVSALILLIYAYVSIGLYYATMGSIQRLAANARTIASGDLGVRVELGTQDELKLVGDSLNEMVAAFGDVLRNVASCEIARNVERVARMADENRTAVVGNAATAMQLERLAQGLETEIRRFRLG